MTITELLYNGFHAQNVRFGEDYLHKIIDDLKAGNLSFNEVVDAATALGEIDQARTAYFLMVIANYFDRDGIDCDFSRTLPVAKLNNNGQGECFYSSDMKQEKSYDGFAKLFNLNKGIYYDRVKQYIQTGTN